MTFPSLSTPATTFRRLPRPRGPTCRCFTAYLAGSMKKPNCPRSNRTNSPAMSSRRLMTSGPSRSSSDIRFSSFLRRDILREFDSEPLQESSCCCAVREPRPRGRPAPLSSRAVSQCCYPLPHLDHVFELEDDTRVRSESSKISDKTWYTDLGVSSWDDDWRQRRRPNLRAMWNIRRLSCMLATRTSAHIVRYHSRGRECIYERRTCVTSMENQNCAAY